MNLIPKKLISYNLQAGFSLVEVLLAVSVFALIVTGLVGGLIYGQQSTALAGQRARAAVLADEGLEAVRNIRDENYSNLTDGTFGLAISANQWVFSGTSDATDIFTRAVTISAAGANRKLVTSAVTWQQNPQRDGSVTLTTYLSNWAASGGGGPPSSCAAYCQSLPAGYTDGTCRQNTQQCSNNSEIYESGGDSICVTNFPGDPSHDTCCCLP
ncbi:prepilin-type N-terminal cleavage/methylation domain-containing protein [Candidatus Collierbacteria bacterium]|nr:prepilin-type N-terminal cleavage/methylation domain-containing protein [Candidatus Collierbacteria bacterium]